MKRQSDKKLTSNNQIQELKRQLTEAHDTIEAIRTGQVDALVVERGQTHQLYTLKTADEGYRFFIEKMSEGAVTINEAGNILYCNPAFTTLLEKENMNFIGLPFIKFIAEKDQRNFTDIFKRSWSEDCSGEFLMLSGSQLKSVKLSLNSLNLADGTLLSVIVTDLTEQKKIQVQLSEQNSQLERTNVALAASNRDLQQFAAIASHDLQEPLRKIKMFSQIVIKNEEKRLTDKSSELLGKILSSVSRMESLIKDLLKYAQLDKLAVPFEKVELNDIIDRIKEDFELIIDVKEARVERDDMPVIEANPVQIRQLFQNIISNALKFSETGTRPEIVISAKRVESKSFSAKEQNDGKFCLFSIKDNGIGLEEKYIENIFDLFGRLNSKDKFEGSGIGLAVVKKILVRHKGLVEVHSTPGKGTTFLILLPVYQNKK